MIEDRWEAIRWAIGSAQTDDCVVIVGRGHKDYVDWVLGRRDRAGEPQSLLSRCQRPLAEQASGQTGLSACRPLCWLSIMLTGSSAGRPDHQHGVRCAQCLGRGDIGAAWGPWWGQGICVACRAGLMTGWRPGTPSQRWASCGRSATLTGPSCPGWTLASARAASSTRPKSDSHHGSLLEKHSCALDSAINAVANWPQQPAHPFTRAELPWMMCEYA